MVLPAELLSLIEKGEGLTTEFKKSRTEVTKDIYETVCAFSNREGGHIFLGVKNNHSDSQFIQEHLGQMDKQDECPFSHHKKEHGQLLCLPPVKGSKAGDFPVPSKDRNGILAA